MVPSRAIPTPTPTPTPVYLNNVLEWLKEQTEQSVIRKNTVRGVEIVFESHNTHTDPYHNVNPVR